MRKILPIINIQVAPHYWINHEHNWSKPNHILGECEKWNYLIFDLYIFLLLSDVMFDN